MPDRPDANPPPASTVHRRAKHRRLYKCRKVLREVKRDASSPTSVTDPTFEFRREDVWVRFD